LASDKITVTGYVTDQQLEDYYQRARVAVVPLLYGAGIKGKVVEAMHHGTPLVTTTVGAQGLSGLDEVIPVCDEPTAIAHAICALLTNDQRWQQVSDQGMRYVAEHFSRHAMQSAFSLDIVGGHQ
jgi:glycosyltransferase involved in cell wall biosynthesis